MPSYPAAPCVRRVQLASATPERAPAAVARAFTASLSIQRQPRVSRVVCPQREWSGASVGSSQVGHQNCAWTVAPKNESKRAPAVPAKVVVSMSTISANRGAARQGTGECPAGAEGRTLGPCSTSGAARPSWRPKRVAQAQAAPTVIAPAMAARVPSGVMPPDVPGWTGRSEVMRRGGRRASRPSSVAQVSAPAAARAPRKPGTPRAPHEPRQAAATPPLASTCHASRRPPFACARTPRRAFSRILKRESALEVMKKVTRAVEAGSPPQARVTAPTPVAAAAPSSVRACLRQPARPTAPAARVAPAQAGHRPDRWECSRWIEEGANTCFR